MEKDLPKFIRGMWHLRGLVIPANAGIYSTNLWKCAVVGVDSRFRGNDRRLEWIAIPNNTSTQNLSSPVKQFKNVTFDGSSCNLRMLPVVVIFSFRF
jgi:hypothetical protein